MHSGWKELIWLKSYATRMKTNHTIDLISEQEFYQYWNKNRSTMLHEDQQAIQYFKHWVDVIPQVALGPFYWQIFDNALPQPKILMAGGSVQELTPFHHPEELISLEPPQLFSFFHPDDLQDTLTFVAKFFSLLLELPSEERVHLHATIYSRVRNVKSQYIWTAIQYPALFFDPSGTFKYGMVLYSKIDHLSGNLHTPMMTILDTRHDEQHHFHCYYPKRPYISHAYPKLTQREKEIIHLLAQGKASKEIAYQLKIAKNTVDNHRQRLLKKFNAVSSAELIFKAIGIGN